MSQELDELSRELRRVREGATTLVIVMTYMFFLMFIVLCVGLLRL